MTLACEERSLENNTELS